MAAIWAGVSGGAADMDADEFADVMDYPYGDIDTSEDGRVDETEGKAYIRCKVTDACSQFEGHN